MNRPRPGVVGEVGLVEAGHGRALEVAPAEAVGGYGGLQAAAVVAHALEPPRRIRVGAVVDRPLQHALRRGHDVVGGPQRPSGPVAAGVFEQPQLRLLPVDAVLGDAVAGEALAPLRGLDVVGLGGGQVDHVEPLRFRVPRRGGADLDGAVVPAPVRPEHGVAVELGRLVQDAGEVVDAVEVAVVDEEPSSHEWAVSFPRPEPVTAPQVRIHRPGCPGSRAPPVPARTGGPCPRDGAGARGSAGRRCCR